MQRFMNLPCWLSVICWYQLILFFQKVIYIILIHYLAEYYLAFLIICQIQLKHNQKLLGRKKNRHMTNNMGSYKIPSIKIKVLSSGFSTDMWRACELSLTSLSKKKLNKWKLRAFIAPVWELRWQAKWHPTLWRGRLIQRDIAKIYLFIYFLTWKRCCWNITQL